MSTSGPNPLINNNNLPVHDQPDFQLMTHQSTHLKSCHGLKKGNTLFPIRSIKEGVKVIEEILKKDILCRHDIDEINETYAEIDRLERKYDSLTGCSSSEGLQKIIDKVKSIARAKQIIPAELISLYHLQRFSDKELPIPECFARSLKKFVKTPENLEKVAAQFPCCGSETQFIEDIDKLIGSTKSDKIAKIVDHKREQLRKHARQQKEIAARKATLAEQRKINLEQYPAYLDELLDNGYPRLYDHIIHMRALKNPEERLAATKKMTFSDVSHVVLETREAVIQKVKISFPDSHHEAVFLLGPTKSGKSTALCFLRGDKMKLKPHPHNCYESDSDRGRLIGKSEVTSCTFLPSIEVIDHFVLVDFPGFEDTNGQLISLGMEFALMYLIKAYRPKILLMQAITEKERGFKAAADLGERLKRLLANKEHCYLGITKYAQDANYGELKSLEAELEVIEKRQKCEPAASTEQNIELIELNAEIETLSELNDPDLQSEIEEKKQQLKRLQQKGPADKIVEIKKTQMEIDHHVKQTENHLLAQIGLDESRVIRFDDLELPALRQSCFKGPFSNS